jgi:hypothetical protein
VDRTTPLPRLTALELLLARSDRTTHEFTTSAEWLMYRFGLPAGSELPGGALSLLGDGGQPGDACWLRADPVHLRVNRDQIVLADHHAFEISQGEAEALTDALNRHFDQDGLVFYPLRPERWYLRTPAAPAILTTPLGEAIGRQVDLLLPRGPEALAWHRLGNEVQMLLHGLPQNHGREAHGLPEINGVWLWGAGPLPTAVDRRYALVVADDPLTTGFGRASGCAPSTLNSDIRRLLADQLRGDVLVFEDALNLARAYGDESGLAVALERLEKTMFAPLLEDLKGGKLERLRIVTFAETGGVCFEATRASLWRFWRSPLALSDYVRRDA